MEVTRTCPKCGELNSTNSETLDTNRDSGVEVWGECWSCHANFRLTKPGEGGEGEDAAAVSTPMASPYLFHMWRPVDQGTGH